MKKPKAPKMDAALAAPPPGPSLVHPPAPPQGVPQDLGPGVTIHIAHKPAAAPIDDDNMVGAQDPDMEVDKMPIKSLKDIAKIKNAIHMGKAKRAKPAMG